MDEMAYQNNLQIGTAVTQQSVQTRIKLLQKTEQFDRHLHSLLFRTQCNTSLDVQMSH